MAGELRVYQAIAALIDGEPQPDFGSVILPQKAVSIAASGVSAIIRRVVVPAGGTVQAWAYGQTGRFSMLAYHVVGGGYVYAASRYSQNTNGSPDGTKLGWQHHGRSCVAAQIFDSDEGYTDSVAANIAGDTAAMPTLWSSGTKVRGIMDILALKNEGTENVVVKLGVWPL